jgi:MFS family permease
LPDRSSLGVAGTAPASGYLPAETLQAPAYRPDYSHLIALALGGTLLALNRTLIYPLLDTVAADLNLTAAQSGFIASLYFVGLLAAQVGVIFLGDQWGLKRILVLAYVAAAFTILALGLWATTYARLLLFIGLQGLTMGVFWPVGYSLAVMGVPAAARGRATAVVGVGLAGGHALGPATSGLLYQLAGSWRLPFAFLALPTIGLAIAFIFLVRETPRPAGPAPAMSWLPVLRDRNLVKLFVASFCTLYGLWVLDVWGPAFLQAERGASLTASGLYVALSVAVSAPAGFILARLSDRVGRRQLSWIMFLLCAAGLATVGFAQPHWVLIVAVVVYGLGAKFAWDPVQIAWLADLTAGDPAKTVGQVVAMTSMIGMTSAVIGPALNGWIRDQTGSLQGAFLVAAVLAVIGAALCASVREHA